MLGVLFPAVTNHCNWSVHHSSCLFIIAHCNSHWNYYPAGLLLKYIFIYFCKKIIIMLRCMSDISCLLGRVLQLRGPDPVNMFPSFFSAIKSRDLVNGYHIFLRVCLSTDEKYSFLRQSSAYPYFYPSHKILFLVFHILN